MENKSIMLELKTFNNFIKRCVEKDTQRHGITDVQFFVLGYILENQTKEIYQKDIEKHLDIRRSTATGILQNLTKGGFIKRISVPNDARLKKIILTRKTKNIIDEFQENINMLEAAIEKEISDDEKNTFISILHKMRKNIEE